jgi:hypothetical protein
VDVGRGAFVRALLGDHRIAPALTPGARVFYEGRIGSPSLEWCPREAAGAVRGGVIVGVVANPASEREIRRLADASVFDVDAFIATEAVHVGARPIRYVRYGEGDGTLVLLDGGVRP